MDNGRHGHNYHWSGLQIALLDDDYEETEVWDVLDDRGGGHRDGDSAPAFYYDDEPKSCRVLKNRASEFKGISRPKPGSGASRVQRSAPVTISYWPKKSKIGPSSSGKKKEPPRDDLEDDDDEKGESDEEEEVGEEDGCHDSRLPPHEFIARRLARSHISSFSVFEGAGRTLKGRDLSKVRRAVLTKTGFLESP